MQNHATTFKSTNRLEFKRWLISALGLPEDATYSQIKRALSPVLAGHKKRVDRTFLGWLRRQAKRDDPIGDLAKDTIEDRRRPRGLTPESLYNRMVDVGACEQAFQALVDARREFAGFLAALEAQG